METEQIAPVLAAAGHPTRLDVLRLLSKETDGLPAGEIARRLSVVQNTMSAHLKKLAVVGLIDVERAGTVLSYRINRSVAACAASVLADL